MNEKLEGMLRVGREKLTAMQAEKNELDARLGKLRAEQEKVFLEKLLELVPVELHEHASHDHKRINIVLPGAAQVSAEYAFKYEYKQYEGMSDHFATEAWLKSDLDKKVWKLSQYEAYEGEIDFVPCRNEEKYAELDVALARAVEIGDGMAEAEAEATKQRAEAEWDAVDDSADETPVRAEICPLMSTAVTQQMCFLHECAWFLRGVCAIKVIVWSGDQQ